MTVRETLLSVLAEVADVDPGRVRDDDSLIDDLDMDSLSMAELTAALEDHLHIVIPEEDVTTFGTVGSCLGYLERAVTQVAGR